MSKKEKATLRNSLNKVLALRPVSWKWKSKKDGTDVRYGFIAQEVEEIFPHLVQEGTWNDGTTRKFLTTDDLIPHLVVAIQEQQVQIEALQTEISKLRKTKPPR